MLIQTLPSKLNTGGLSHPAHSSVIEIIAGAANVMNSLRHTQSHPMRFEKCASYSEMSSYYTLNGTNVNETENLNSKEKCLLMGFFSQ